VAVAAGAGAPAGAGADTGAVAGTTADTTTVGAIPAAGNVRGAGASIAEVTGIVAVGIAASPAKLPADPTEAIAKAGAMAGEING
jgi:hypothetical protein